MMVKGLGIMQERELVASGALEVVPERFIDGYTEGYSENYIRVYITGETGDEPVKVRVDGLYKDGVCSHLCEQK